MSTQQTESIEPQARGRAGGAQKVRSDVLVAARKMFSEHGIHAVSVRDIAKEVGVSHTLLHLYFGSKDEIVRQVLQSYQSGIAEGGPAVGADGIDIAESFKAAVGQSDFLRVLAAALLERVVPERVSPDFKTPLVAGASLKAPEGVDPKVLGMVFAATAVGWATSADWLREQFGVADMTEEQLLTQVGELLDRMAAK